MSASSVTRRAKPGPVWRPFVTVLMWASLCVLVAAWGGMYSWHYFLTGADVIGSGQAVHLFASHPELQMGPLTPLAALALVRMAGRSAEVGAAAMLLIGAGVALALRGLRPAGDVSPPTDAIRASLGAGLVLSPAWAVLAVHYGHLDDALALLATTAAMVAVSRGRWIAAAVLLGAATGFKPWAAPVAVVLLSGPRAVRTLATFVGVVVLAWLPFVAGDPRTLHLASFTISVAPDSPLRVLGSSALGTPLWDRPAQLLLGVVLALWAVRRGRTRSVPFLVLAARMLLDPGTYPYYTSGLVVAALVVDVSRPPRRPRPAARSWEPRLTLATGVFMATTAAGNAVGLPLFAGVVRTLFLVAAPLLVLLAPDERKDPQTLDPEGAETVPHDRLRPTPTGLS